MDYYVFTTYEKIIKKKKKKKVHLKIFKKYKNIYMKLKYK